MFIDIYFIRLVPPISVFSHINGLIFYKINSQQKYFIKTTSFCVLWGLLFILLFSCV